MPTAVTTVIVRKSPEVVFDYLADISKHGEWSPKAYTATKVTDGTVGVGTKYRSVGWLPNDSKHENEVEVTAFERPRRFAWTATDQGQAFKSEFTLTPTNGGTRVERVTDMPKPTGFLGVVFPVIFTFLVKPDIQKGLNAFRDKAEAQA
jgi:uncharacterized protein YndB with AHSA1/START domain